VTLRRAVVVVLGALFAAALACWLRGVCGVLPPCIALGLLLVSFFVERGRYSGAHPTPPELLRETGERFIDPASGENVTVYEDANAPGVRVYRTP